METRTSGSTFAGAWRADRAYLVDLAFRMLHDVGAAEDVVQEAFLRLSVAGGGIEDPRGWLTVVTSRLCLDQIRSARVRREHSSTVEVVERVLDSASLPPAAGLSDPADRVTLDDEVRTALAVVLDRLTPAERVALVLHEVFRFPYPEIERTLGKSAAACRQLVRRARQKVSDTEGGRVLAPDPQLPDLSRAFLAACAEGDLGALLALLHPDVWGVAEVAVGPGRPPIRHERHVADAVARTLLHHFGITSTLVTLPGRSGPVFLAARRRRPYATLTTRVEAGRIVSIRAVIGGPHAPAD